ncbi:MAG: hypothetical protein Kapaf2KO_17290 [Candidatus Kapaibacteriales bacterium]
MDNSSDSTTLIESVTALEKFMPEMLPLYSHICRLVRADQEASRFLTGFRPPPYNSACSQAVSTLNDVQLVRNYDYHPQRFEGVLLYSKWNGKGVIANTDCLIGVLDGINESGLAVSLTFGGRRAVGYGFGIPFILRYILEFCDTVKEGVEVLKKIPSHMSYNVTLADKTRTFQTVEISPDRNAIITDSAFTTNHQGPIEWAENAGFNETAQRASYLENVLYRGIGGLSFTNCFLHPPLYNRQYNKGLGTLYTASYFPESGKMEMHWPGYSIQQSFKSFTQKEIIINYNNGKIVN